MTDAIPTLTLHLDDLSWLDLMLLGALEPCYVIPVHQGAVKAPSLRVPTALSQAAEGSLDLLDPEGVTLARVTIDKREASADPSQTWIAGPVEAVSGFSHLDNLDMRRTPTTVRETTTSTGPLVAIWTPVPSPYSLRQATAQLARAKGARVMEVVPVPSGQETSQRANLAARLARLEVTRAEGDIAVVVPAPTLDWSPESLLLRARIVAAYGADTLAVSPLVMEELGTDRAHVEREAYELGVELTALSVLNQHSAMSAGELHALLEADANVPEWFAEDAVTAELRRLHRGKSASGLTVLLSGLSGSGKSTVARALSIRLLETEVRSVSLLDGDVVRHHLSKGLGFARADRDTNVRRIGFVASEITKSGGIAIACPIAPYDTTRRDVRAMVEEHGGFVLVHIATPLEECERRDRKGLYAKARRGEIPEFTGISDPYEVPEDAEVVVDTTGRTHRLVRRRCDGGAQIRRLRHRLDELNVGVDNHSGGDCGTAAFFNEQE